MKVIFLDVDGVLNSNSFADKMFKAEGVRIFNENIIDRRSISCLRSIVHHTNAAIVLSSSWRKIQKARADLAEQLSEYGLVIHSDTPYTGGERGDDITAWFEEHKNVPIESYVILDDDDDMGVHIGHLIRTSFYGWGLETKHIQRAVDMLNRK